jgi:hypothetical protein
MEGGQSLFRENERERLLINPNGLRTFNRLRPFGALDSRSGPGPIHFLSIFGSCINMVVSLAISEINHQEFSQVRLCFNHAGTRRGRNGQHWPTSHR